MWSLIVEKLKGMVKRMLGVKTVEQALHVVPAISSKMAEAIDLWSKLYCGEADWLHEPTYENPTKVVSLGLPAMIASEKARMATIEMKSEITTPTETEEKENPDYTPPTMDEFGTWYSSGQPKTLFEEKPVSDTQRAEYLNEQYSKLMGNIRTQLEYGIAKGGLVIKPYIVMPPKDSEDSTPQIEFDYIQADAFYPLSFDGSGKVTEAAFLQRKFDKESVYSRLEYHKLEGTTVKVQNKAYKSTNNTKVRDTGNGGNTAELGQEIPLTDVPEWKDLPPETTIKNVDRLLFGYFRMPEANTIDPHSPLGVSGYSRAIKLIREADLQYSRMLWEFEGGELAIDIDRDAFNQQEGIKDSHGNVRMVETISNLQRRLYRKIDLGESDTYKPYNPTLRDASLINGLNTILMRIEDVCSMSRGTLSDASNEARTATELKILKQRSYSANLDIQKALENTLRDVVYIMNTYCVLYGITPEGEWDVSFEWDDSILVDVEAELNKRITLMNNGLTSKLELRMWYFGETENQAREALDKVGEESRQAMEENMMHMPNIETPQDGFQKK